MMKRSFLEKPCRLKLGDTIGIAAPASSFDTGNLNRGVKIIESMGFRVRIPDGIQAQEGYLAGSDAHRAALINHLFADPEIKAIVAARGGYGSLRILPGLDVDGIRSHPKICVGFSDITALLNVLCQHCNLVTFHGPVVTSIGESTRRSADAMYSMLTSSVNPEIRVVSPVEVYQGTASGTVLGGNLCTLCHMCGTPYQPDLEGAILFLEDRGEPLYKIDRMITQMKYAGCFDGLRALALGTFDDCGPIEEVHRLFGRLFRDFRIPILAGFEVGHGGTNLTLALGASATLDTRSARLVYHEAPTVR